MSSINQEAHAESGRVANHNKTQEAASAPCGCNGKTENVFSTGEADAENIGREPEQNSGAAGGDIVANLRALLGVDAVLIPVRQGQKAPISASWQQTTIEAMDDGAHLTRLRSGNIGVVLGVNSNGLCAIDIDADDKVEPFLALNPLLRTTLTTRGARGAQFWVKIVGEYPKSVKLKGQQGAPWGEWRADGNQSVIYGVHPSGERYQRLMDTPPISVAFDAIIWPDQLKLPWVEDEYDRLVREHGESYALSSNGALNINDYFFVVRYQREHPVLWEPLEEEFYQYDAQKGLWSVISDDRIKWQFGLDLKRAADEAKVQKFLWKRNDAKLASFVNTLRGVVEQRDAFKKKVPVIHFANGMLDLENQPPRLMSFHPDYHSRNICPIAFDPEAECPRFINELLRTALNEDDISLLQRWAGSVLLGKNPAQRVLLLVGTAGGGKSTLIEVIEKVIGEQNVAQLRTKHLNKQFELFRFLGKTLLTGKDVNAGFLSEDGAEVIKALVGNDLLDAEKKRGNEPFQLRGNFNVAITCNSKLRVRLEGDTGAWERRLMIINYEKPKPKERITEFADKLIKAEGAGILNWMIEGAIQYLHETNTTGDIVFSAAQQDRVDLLLAESDSVRQFVEDRVVACEGADVTVAELQQAYFKYCDEMGWLAFSGREFQCSIADLMLELRHVSRRNDIPRTGEKAARGFKHITTMGGEQ